MTVGSPGILFLGILCSGLRIHCSELSSPCSPAQCNQLKGHCLQTNNSTSNCTSCLGVIDCTYPITDCSCSVDGNPCYNGECIDVEEGYLCNCSYGWSGKYCHIDDDFCHTSMNKCIHGQCIEGIGPNIHCDCLDNYRGDTCDEIFCTDDYCKNGGTCQIIGKNIACECKIGYYGNQCENEVVKCTKTDCESISGACYSDDDNDCICFGVLNCTTPITHCSMADPYLTCLHGGMCVNKTNDSINCICLHAGLTGEHCEDSVKVCGFIDCSGHGQCIEGLGVDYTCECEKFYTGDDCDTCSCPEDYCKNGGTCNLIPVSGGASCAVNCTCMGDYTGDTCETDLTNVCNGNKTCNNNGKCIEQDGYEFECLCDYGYTGFTCSDELSPCELNPCLNNGTCIDSQCACQEDFGGGYCEIDLIDICASNVTCLNGGTCVDGPGSTYECLCPKGFNGTNCEIDLQYCDYLEESICGGCQEDTGNSVICLSCFKICNCKMCACAPSYCYDEEEVGADAAVTAISCEYTATQSLEVAVTMSCSCNSYSMSTFSTVTSETDSVSSHTLFETTSSSSSSSISTSTTSSIPTSISSPRISPQLITTNHVDDLFENLIAIILVVVCLIVTVVILLSLMICIHRTASTRHNHGLPSRQNANNMINLNERSSKNENVYY